MTVDDKIAYLTEYSSVSGISLEVLLSIYLILDEDIFFVLNMFEGMKVKFPQTERMSKVFKKNYRIFDLTEFKEVEIKNCTEKVYFEELEKGDELVQNGEVFIVYKTKVILGRKYVVCYKGDNKNE